MLNYSTYLKNWETFSFRIKAQIDKETTSRLEMNTEWEKIKAKSNAGGLMRLIQAVCVHGTDRDYIPERVINCFATLFNSKQGKATPSEFSETMTSNHQVLVDVLGVNVFGLIPILQEFVIDRYDDLNFKFKDFNLQNAETRGLVSQRCVDCILGCNMTLRSNKERSDMSAEVHKSLLSKHEDAFAMNTAEAVDQMIGFEALKRASPKQAKYQGSGDTSSAIMLMGVSSPNPDKEFRCYNCNEEGHSQYKCPKLNSKERQSLYLKSHKSPDESSDSNNNIVSQAVLIHLGGNLSDEEEEDDIIYATNEELEEDDHTIYIDNEPRYDDESGEIVKNFVLCQISDGDEISFPSDYNDYDEQPLPNEAIIEPPSVLETNTEELEQQDVDDDNVDHDRTEMLRVLTNVARAQRKHNPVEWVNAVIYKLSLVGITTITLLHVSIPNLNRRLNREGHSTLHNTTLGGLSVEAARAISGDRTIVPDFYQGHA